MLRYHMSMAKARVLRLICGDPGGLKPVEAGLSELPINYVSG
jgi:putative component of toxin-antitoxin plasmid stabilization module